MDLRFENEKEVCVYKTREILYFSKKVSNGNFD